MANQHPFPILTQMRAYKPELNWHGNDPILSSISLPELNAKGFINVPWEQIPQDVRYHARKAAAVMKAPDFVSWSDPEDRTLHPVLRRANFPTTSDQNYEFLKPVLRLVSDMLARPELLGFFKGLAGEGYPIDDPKAERRLGTKPRGFRPEKIAVTDKAEMQRVYEMVGKLGGCVIWSFEGPFNEATKDFIAYCIHQDGVPSGCHPEGQASFIALRPEFMAVMNGGITASQVHPELNDDSALLRSRLLLAKCMLHELAHSFNYAYTSKNEKLEPFMADEWVAETGRALEMWLFNGIIHAAGHNPFHAAVPFGLFFHKFPDGDTTYTMPVALKSLGKAGIKSQSYYAINMQWVRKLFLTSFWTTEMDRFGSDLLILPRKLGVRYRTDHQLWDDESPGPWSPKFSPNTGRWTFVQHRRLSDDWTMWQDFYEGVLRDEDIYPLGEDGQIVRDALVARGGTVNRTMPDGLIVDTTLRTGPDMPTIPPPVGLGIMMPPPRTPSPILAPTSPMSDVDYTEKTPSPEPMEGIHTGPLKSPLKPQTALKKPSPKKPKSSSPKDPKGGPKGPPPGGAAIMVGHSTTTTAKAPMAVMVAPTTTALVPATVPSTALVLATVPSMALVPATLPSMALVPATSPPSPEPMEDVVKGPVKSPPKLLPAPKQPSTKTAKSSPPKGPTGGPKGPPPGELEFKIKGVALKPKSPPRKSAPTSAAAAKPPSSAPKALLLPPVTAKKAPPTVPKKLPPSTPKAPAKALPPPSSVEYGEGMTKTGTDVKGAPTPMSGVKTTSPPRKPPTPMSGVKTTTPLKPTVPAFVPGKPTGPFPVTPTKPEKLTKAPPPPKKSPPALGYLGAHKVEHPSPSKPGKAPAVTPTADDTPSKPSKVIKKKKAPGKPIEPPPAPKKSPPKMGYLGAKTPPPPSKLGLAPAVTPTAYETPSGPSKITKETKVTKKTKTPTKPKKASFHDIVTYSDSSSDSKPSSKSSAEDSVFGGSVGAPPETYELAMPAWMGGDGLAALTLDADDDDDLYKGKSEDEMDVSEHGHPLGATGTHKPPADETDTHVGGDTDSDDLYKGKTSSSSSDEDDAPGAGGTVVTIPIVKKTKCFAIKSKEGIKPAPKLKLSFPGKTLTGGEAGGVEKKPKSKTPSPPKLGYPYESKIAKTPLSKPLLLKGKKGKKTLPPVEELSESPLDKESPDPDSDSLPDMPLSSDLIAAYLKAKKLGTYVDDSEGGSDDSDSGSSDGEEYASAEEDDAEAIPTDALVAYLEAKKEKLEKKLVKYSITDDYGEGSSKYALEKYGDYEGDDWEDAGKDGPPPSKKGKTSKDDGDEVPKFAPMPKDVGGKAAKKTEGYEDDETLPRPPSKKSKFSKKKDGDEEAKFAPMPKTAATSSPKPKKPVKKPPPMFEFKGVEGTIPSSKPKKKMKGKKKDEGKGKGKGKEKIVVVTKEDEEDKVEDEVEEEVEEERKDGKGGKGGKGGGGGGTYPPFKKAKKKH